MHVCHAHPPPLIEAEGVEVVVGGDEPYASKAACACGGDSGREQLAADADAAFEGVDRNDLHRVAVDGIGKEPDYLAIAFGDERWQPACVVPYATAHDDGRAPRARQQGGDAVGVSGSNGPGYADLPRMNTRPLGTGCSIDSCSRLQLHGRLSGCGRRASERGVGGQAVTQAGLLASVPARGSPASRQVYCYFVIHANHGPKAIAEYNRLRASSRDSSRDKPRGVQNG